MIDSTNPSASCTLSANDVLDSRNEAFSRRDAARSSKEAAWVILGAVHLLQLVEAFVDRHLINFDTTEDLSLHNRPENQLINRYQTWPSVNLVRVRIPLHGQ